MGGLTKQNEEKKEKIVRIEKAVEELPKQYEDKLSRGRIMSTEYEPITGNVNKRRNVMKDSSPTILGKTGRSKCRINFESKMKSDRVSTDSYSVILTE